MMTPDLLKRLSARFGWRGLWLIAVGALYVGIGAAVALTPPVGSAPHSWVLYEYASPVLRGIAWALCGMFAIGVGMRGPGRNDAKGHVALYIMPTIRLASYVVSGVVNLATWAIHSQVPQVHVAGWPSSWYSALVWGAFYVMLAIGAAWPNPAPVLPKPPLEARQK